MDYRYLSPWRSLIQQSPIETTHEERLTAERGSMEVVPVEIGGSTQPILPKPHLIIPMERRDQERGGLEYVETRLSSVSSLYPLPKVPRSCRSITQFGEIRSTIGSGVPPAATYEDVRRGDASRCRPATERIRSSKSRSHQTLSISDVWEKEFRWYHQLFLNCYE